MLPPCSTAVSIAAGARDGAAAAAGPPPVVAHALRTSAQRHLLCSIEVGMAAVVPVAAAALRLLLLSLGPVEARAELFISSR